MIRNNFWNDAARCGAIIGGVSACCSLLGDSTGIGVFALVGFALHIWLLIRCTRRRATRCSTPDAEYGFGRRLGFIVATSLFVGIIDGAYAIVAGKMLFAAKYAAAAEQSFAMLADTGLYSKEMLATARHMIQSPACIAFSAVLGQLLFGAVFGLVIAALAQPYPQPFRDKEE